MISSMVAAWLISIAPATTDDGSVSLADLDGYRAALASGPDPRAPAIQFADLWAHPEAFAGRAVRLEGKLARRFRQDRLGDFPALVEAWIVSPAGDPTCFVYPDQAGVAGPEVGSDVRFSGTFLRKIRYRGADEARLAPLIVGPAAPTPVPRPAADLDWPGSAIDWAVGLGGSALILLVLLRRHMDRPKNRPPVLDPAPRFIDGEDDAEGADHGTA